MDERTKELGSQLNNAPEEELENEDEEETEEEVPEEDEEEIVEEPKKPETEGGEAKENKEKPGNEPSEADKQGRWHGKSREEVIKSFEDLENQLNDLKKPDKINEPEKQKQEPAKNELDIPTDEELAKMTPKGFAEWMIKTVGKMVNKTYESRSQVKDAVTGEIREVQKAHPLLKSNQEYRELVLALIDTAAQKGTVLPLKEACTKVDAMIGKVKGENKVSDEDKARLKKAKAQVERGAGAPTSPGEEKGVEQKRLESIFGTGRSKSPFGGLGV